MSDEDNYAARAQARAAEGWPAPTNTRIGQGAVIEANNGTWELWNSGVLLAICPSERLAKLVLEGLSPRLDSRAPENFAAGLELCRKALKQRHQNCIDGQGESVDFMRALRSVRTKLDEAELWMTKATWT